MKKTTKHLIISAAFILLSSCFLPVRYYQARSLYLKSSYQEAIQIYDKYLETAPNSARRIQAEIERSDCYYQLGYNEFQAKNWTTACRLFYLANSPIADLMLDDCYFNLAVSRLTAADTLGALGYFDQLITDLPAGDKVPAALSIRVKISLQQNRRDLAFDDYNLLLQDYPQSEYTQNIQPEIENLIPSLIADAQSLKELGELEEASKILLKIIVYTTSFTPDIKSNIAELYRLLAEKSIQNNELSQARSFFSKAYDYDQSLQQGISARIEELCGIILKKGDRLLSDLQFSDAVATYSLCYELVEGYAKAQKAIENANLQKQNYEKSQDLFKEAAELENLRNYSEASNIYKQAAGYYPSEKISEKIFIMQNIIAAQNDPKAFAKSVVLEYKNGALVKAVERIEQEMISKYGTNVSSSNWMVTFAIGQHKYEVRFDILSPNENYYFAWNVDIRTKKVMPSNKVSEKLMLDADLIKLEDLKK